VDCPVLQGFLAYPFRATALKKRSYSRFLFLTSCD